jgi:hypothetical protein
MRGYERIIDLALPITSLEPRVDGTPWRGMGWLEVAVAMASLTREGSDLLRALYLDDPRALRHTLDRLVVSLSGNPGLSISMQHAIAATSFQAFASQRPCVTCAGLGTVSIREHDEMDEDGVWTHCETAIVECPSCGGEGVDYVELRAVREMLEVGELVFENLVAVPFLDCYEQVRNWHDDAVAKLARRIR